jgi:hypothetical protein
MRNILLGAYAASPEFNQESYFLAINRLVSDGLASGWEIPYHFYPFEGFHPAGPSGLMPFLNKNASIIVTCLPAQMQAMAKDQHFGLASDDLNGRERALRLVQRAVAQIRQLQDMRPDLRIIAIELHSGPRPAALVRSSLNSFILSLNELCATSPWPSGLGLWIEHCDAYRVNQVAAKGFLSLKDEIEAMDRVRRVAQNYGIDVGGMINWGRSAIEGCNASLPIEHIRCLAQAGFCRGLIFSGATSDHPLYGQWNDTHAPIAEAEADKRLLLTRERIVESVREVRRLAGDDVSFGLKVQALPTSLDVSSRVEFVQRNLRVLNEALNAAFIDA